MKFVFLGGGPSGALPRELRQLGHEVLSEPAVDWYHAMVNHVDPQRYADRAMAEIDRFEPDVLVLNKGWHSWQGRSGWWHVPPSFLQRAREKSRRSVYICYDDPAATPISIQLGIPQGFDLWLTTCPGIPRLFPSVWPRIRAQVHEFWLAWDTESTWPREWDRAVERHGCDLAVTGTPYHKPFPPPHYRGGFAGPRRDLVMAAIREGFNVGLYGPQTWLNRRHGGDPRFSRYYRGWIDPNRIHVVHKAATTVLGTHLVEGHRYDSGRLPWVGGAGGALIHELRPGLRDEFGPAVAWYKPGDVDEFLTRLRALTSNEPLNRRMREELHARVVLAHTWAHRARKLVELCL